MVITMDLRQRMVWMWRFIFDWLIVKMKIMALELLNLNCQKINHGVFINSILSQATKGVILALKIVYKLKVKVLFY